MSPRYFSKVMHSPYFKAEHYANTPGGKIEQKVEEAIYNFFHLKNYLNIKKFRKIRQKDCLNFKYFDEKYNINTSHIIVPVPGKKNTMGPGIQQNNDKYPISNGYQVCALKHIDQVCKELEKINNIHNYEFVDIGSGKGKIIFYNILKNRKFASYVGIEIDENLHNDANKNLKTTNININKDVTFLNIDAFSYVPNQRESIYFLYRPFSLELQKDFFTKNKNVFENSPTIIVLMCPYEGIINFLKQELNFKIIKDNFVFSILKN